LCEAAQVGCERAPGASLVRGDASLGFGDLEAFRDGRRPLEEFPRKRPPGEPAPPSGTVKVDVPPETPGKKP